MKSQRLTPRQQSIYDFVKAYLEANRVGPYIREIQAGCGIRSYKSVVDRLNALERKGFIKRAANKHRGIRVVRRPPEMAVAAGIAPLLESPGEQVPA